MIFITGGYVPIRSIYHKRLRGLMVPVVHQKSRGLHQAYYHGVPFLARDYINAAGRYTLKDVAVETTKNG